MAEEGFGVELGFGFGVGCDDDPGDPAGVGVAPIDALGFGVPLGFGMPLGFGAPESLGNGEGLTPLPMSSIFGGE
jgi:hypothetical protein